MFSLSFKENEYIFLEPLKLFSNKSNIKNYIYILNNIPIFKYFFNTFFISAIITFGKIISSVLAAYVFAFKDFKHKRKIISLYFITCFIPFTITMIPNYLTISKMGLLNNPFGVIIPQLADASGIFFILQNMRSIPKSLIEVSLIEDISEEKTLFFLIIPMIKNSLIAISILFFINSWNEYFWPLIILSDKENYTLSLALQMFISSEGGNNWGITMALSCLSIIFPILLYSLSQRKIMESFTKSGIKG